TLDQLIRRCGLRRDEVATLAEIGALNAFGFDRRTALWQIEQAVRPAGELFEEREGIPPAEVPAVEQHPSAIGHRPSGIGTAPEPRSGEGASPLRPMPL